MESKYGSMTIPQLREELKKRSAKISGRKNELVERLVAYERNQNFCQTDILEPEYKMTLPVATSYFDVNADSKFCGSSMACLHDYLNKYEKQFDTNVTQFYHERFLRYFRVSHEDDVTFVKSSCHAAMKKAICYEIDIKMDHGGSIIEAQCECAAGMGPHAHCKHVCTTIYGAVMFVKKRTVNTEESCTQKLQSFHKCKKFVGSPLKANSLQMPGADEITNIETFDPRPTEFRNSKTYQDHFRNTCFNFPGISTIPIFQIFEPANTRAVAHDHDYLLFTQEDTFLHNINVTRISQEQIMEIENRTLGQSTNKEWKEERTKRLPSSMFGRICKATERTDKTKLARSFTVISDIKAAPLDHGHRHESVAIQRYMNDSGNAVHRCGLVVSHDFPFLASSPDGFVNKQHIVEVKCPYTSRDKTISPVTVPYLKLDSEGQYTLENTHDYYYQIQGQLLCTGAQNCTLVVCTANDLKVNDIVYIDISRNDTFIEQMVEDLRSFFYSHFRPELLEKHFYKSYFR